MANHCNPDVNNIIGYVEQHNSPLLSRAILGSVSPRYFNVMTGVKGTTNLHTFDNDINFTCGDTCGFHPSVETTFVDKEMCVLPLNVHAVFCDKNLLDTWANHEVKVAAGTKNMPFEEEWTDNIVKKVQEKIEFQIWQGTHANSYSCSNETEVGRECICSGILDELYDLGSRMYSREEGITAYKYFINTFNQLPDDIKGTDDLIAFVGTGLYYKLIQSIMETSHFHIDGNDLVNGFIFPGTNVRVVATNALNSWYKPEQQEQYIDLIVITRMSNLYYGTDLRGDEEKFDLWYSKDNREFRLAIEFTMGAAIAITDDAALGYTPI